MNKFKLKLKPNSIVNMIVDDNNQPLLCPDQQSIVLPGQLQGQLQIMREPCSSNCPFFYHDLLKEAVIIKCRQTDVIIELNKNNN